MKGEIEVRDALNESLVVLSTSVPNATDNFGGMPPKHCTVFGWISPVRNLIFGGDPRKMERSSVVYYKTFTREQNQGDAPTEGNNVGTECVMDYSDQFTTYSIFNGRDALLRWAREQGKLNNIVIVIKRSDYGGEGKRRPRVILACERNSNYKSCKSSETTDIRSDANSDMKKCARDTGTKKCGCPFLLKGVNIGDGDDWKLEVVCGVHNHPISEYLQGHSFVGRLTEEENAFLVDMSKSLVKPRDILVTIKDRDAMNVSTMKTIYNARIRNRTKEFVGRTQMQQLLTKLSEHNYIEWHRTSCDIVTDLFWTHPINIDILRAFPHHDIYYVDALSCGCAIRRTHQLPCAHEIAEYKERDVPIPLDVVHSHWRKLDIINIGNSSHGTTSPGRSQLQRFNMWYEQQDGEKKRQVHMTLDELMNPGSTALTEPKEKLKTKMRPRKVDTSIRWTTTEAM
ncbi:unnamed protein product [Prunus armeniaca]